MGGERIAGVDFSTHAVDRVTLPLSGDAADGARWDRVLIGDVDDGDLRAFRAVRHVRPRLSRLTWTDVELVFVEAPFNRAFDVLKKLARIQGAIIAAVPKTVSIVEETRATEWKQGAGLRSNADKDDVMNRALELGFEVDGPMPQDAADAFLIAYGIRELLTKEARRQQVVA